MSGTTWIWWCVLAVVAAYVCFYVWLRWVYTDRAPMRDLGAQRLGRWNAAGISNAKRPSLKVVQP